MKTLIINNYLNPNKIKELKDAVKLYSDYKIIEYSDIGSRFTVPYEINAIVLSGSEARIVKAEHVKMYDGVINLIINTSLPILGICFGHQLACLTLGANVGALINQVKNFENVRIIKKDKLFEGFKVEEKIPLAEYHNDYVERRSLRKSNLELLADSFSCEVEAVKHITKPFYGIQFHAERIRMGKEVHRDGLRIIKNFIEISRN